VSFTNRVSPCQRPNGCACEKWRLAITFSQEYSRFTPAYDRVLLLHVVYCATVVERPPGLGRMTCYVWKSHATVVVRHICQQQAIKEVRRESAALGEPD